RRHRRCRRADRACLAGRRDHRLRHQSAHARGGACPRRGGTAHAPRLRGGERRRSAVRGTSFRRRDDRVRHPQRTADRQGALRGTSGAEARRALPVPRILGRRHRRHRPALRPLFAECHTGDGRTRHRRPRTLPLPRRVDPALPQSGTLRRHASRRRLRAGGVPQPLRRDRRDPFRLETLMAGSVAALFRLAYAGFVLAREGAFAVIDPESLPTLPRRAVKLARLFERRQAASSRAERLSAAATRLGPSYVKLGQFLATRPDIVGAEAAAMFGRLRDEMPSFPDDEARAQVAQSLGRPVEELFASFSTPVAAASIAQVHKAEIAGPDGLRPVAVKVLRPGIRRRFRRDLETFYAGARFIERIDPASRRLRPVAVVDTLARSVTIEMDLRLEAAALSEMAHATAGDSGFRVPRV